MYSKEVKIDLFENCNMKLEIPKREAIEKTNSTGILFLGNAREGLKLYSRGYVTRWSWKETLKIISWIKDKVDY